jgi:hypothetical protein
VEKYYLSVSCIDWQHFDQRIIIKSPVKREKKRSEYKKNKEDIQAMQALLSDNQMQIR